MQANTLPPAACANWKDGDGVCPNEGKLACGSCKLVLVSRHSFTVKYWDTNRCHAKYCGRDCQVKHWSEHKKACKSPMRKESWLPAWDRDRRDPAWAQGAAATNIHNPFGMNRHLWGNTPAMDVLNLPRNEGSDYDKDISILFAASGDLRNAAKTVQCLPEGFDHQVKITLNDRDPVVALRNVILLLLMLKSLEEASDEASIDNLAETLIHVWYSAMITSDMLSQLESKVKPLVKEACFWTPFRESGDVLRKKWDFQSGASLDVSIERDTWSQLLKFLEVPEHLTAAKARDVRIATMLAPERQDYRDRWGFKDASPSMRVARQRFREDGILLPFGHPRLKFDIPNPTLFQAADCWPMDDKADPLDGWPIGKVRATPFRAGEDLYGKLFWHIRGVLSAFIRRVATGKIHFEVLNIDVADLDQLVEKGSFDRIEASNISDVCWLGTRETLRCLIPLLKPPQRNLHATLITVYLNAIIETSKRDGLDNERHGVELIKKYLNISERNIVANPQGAEMYRIWDARSLTFNPEKFFRRYMVDQRFRQAAEELGVVMKEHNTIGDAWPMSLKLRPGEPGAQEEFDGLLASGATGVERFVEWKRVR
ncbi:uncharacterized protein F4822DRAFT_240795 [Hypoxylon trugodes]|uniref:uncharacterized protein n=1 Tax=Hypoxylon trugodes TaxID=326681 RepID=UPI00219BE6EC|nr:uncharacterized protein F4822DRAFT_240795 [Hypoxylon trugodes]KAI1388290.1 hypothetical protein F4822DRAFT_240795 [Hypoxylon trugodes]